MAKPGAGQPRPAGRVIQLKLFVEGLDKAPRPSAAFGPWFKSPPKAPVEFEKLAQPWLRALRSWNRGQDPLAPTGAPAERVRLLSDRWERCLDLWSGLPLAFEDLESRRCEDEAPVIGAQGIRRDR